MSVGSCCEAEYQLLLAADLGYLHERGAAELISAIQEVRKMLAAYLNRLRLPPTRRDPPSSADH